MQAPGGSDTTQVCVCVCSVRMHSSVLHVSVCGTLLHVESCMCVCCAWLLCQQLTRYTQPSDRPIFMRTMASTPDSTPNTTTMQRLTNTICLPVACHAKEKVNVTPAVKEQHQQQSMLVEMQEPVCWRNSLLTERHMYLSNVSVHSRWAMCCPPTQAYLGIDIGPVDVIGDQRCHSQLL